MIKPIFFEVIKHLEVSIMASEFEVPADKLAWRCDLSFLPFTCTADMTAFGGFYWPRAGGTRHRIWPGSKQAGIQYFRYWTYGNRQNQHHQGFSKKDNRRTSSGRCRLALSRRLVLLV